MGLKPVLFFIPVAVMLVAIALAAGVGAVSGQGQICANSQGQTPCASLVVGQQFTLGAICPTLLFMSNVPSGAVYTVSCSNNIGQGFPSETVDLFFSGYIVAIPNSVFGGGYNSVSCPGVSASTTCNVEIYPVLSSTLQVNLGADILAQCIGGMTIGISTMTCQVTSPYIQSQPATSSGLFSFVAGVGVNSNGWVILAVTLIGVAVIAGISILGSSPGNDESIHILFVGGGMVGIWLILVLVEGFPGPTELFFNSINSMLPAAGTAVFMLLTLIYSVGIFTAISRGV